MNTTVDFMNNKVLVEQNEKFTSLQVMLSNLAAFVEELVLKMAEMNGIEIPSNSGGTAFLASLSHFEIIESLWILPRWLSKLIFRFMMLGFLRFNFATFTPG